MHGVLAVLFEHQFREMPGLLIVIHGPLRPGPLPVAELTPFKQAARRTDVTGSTGTADFQGIQD
jgi:hypothetical protein